jgi:hypothetical protein
MKRRKGCFRSIFRSSPSKRDSRARARELTSSSRSLARSASFFWICSWSPANLRRQCRTNDETFAARSQLSFRSPSTSKSRGFACPGDVGGVTPSALGSWIPTLGSITFWGVFTFAPSSFRVWQSNKSYQLFSWNQPRFCLSAQRMSTSSGRPLNDFLIDTRTTQQRRYRNILDELFEYSCSNRRRTIYPSPYTQIPHT